MQKKTLLNIDTKNKLAVTAFTPYGEVEQQQQPCPPSERLGRLPRSKLHGKKGTSS